MKSKVLKVIYKDNLVGRLAQTSDHKIAFQYDKLWTEKGFSISPFSLPLNEKLYISNKNSFNGLFGVFADSLPDAWGNLVLDRYLKKIGIDISSLNVLDRLSIIGKSGKGGLEYLPEYKYKKSKKISLEEIALQVEQILESKITDKIEELFSKCGSSGGTRPKFNFEENGEEYIIKIPYKKDIDNSGLMEYEYYLCAIDCGIDMSFSKTININNEICFMTKRFDRPKKHMISAAALLEVDFENVVVDYHQLMKLTRIITNNNLYDIRQMYKRMCFNVFASNQDDHLKNFSFIYSDDQVYRLAPAYDLTYSISGYGEHTTTINNKGKNILDGDLLEVGIKAGLKKKDCLDDIKLIKEKVKVLDKWKK